MLSTKVSLADFLKFLQYIAFGVIGYLVNEINDLKSENSRMKMDIVSLTIREEEILKRLDNIDVAIKSFNQNMNEFYKDFAKGK
ncbi:MAG: hypothetical protein AAFN93_02675 [Bacteroidota bacterium]